MPQVSTRLGRWHWDEYGEPASPGDPTLVLLHELTLDRRMWSGQVAALEPLARVMAFDGPGHGLSEVPPPFVLEEQAEALAEALGTRAVERAVLVGHGWGGLVALRFALQHPDRTAGLVLVGTTADGETPPQRQSRQRFVDRLIRYGALRWFIRARLARLIYGPRALRERPDLLVELYRTVNSHPRDGLARAARAVLDRGSVAARLARVWAPTLVIHGERDRNLAAAHSEKLARRIPGARLVRMDSGHTPPVERPAQMQQVLVPFVRACLARRPRRGVVLPLRFAGADLGQVIGPDGLPPAPRCLPARRG